MHNKHEFVRDFFKQSGCELIGEVSLSRKIKYKCNCGEINEIYWYNFKNGERCRKCSFLKTQKNNPKRIKISKMIHDYFKSKNCVLLEEEYINQKTPMRYICECGIESIITWKNFKNGCRCAICAKNKIKNRYIPNGESHFRWNPNRDDVLLRKTIRDRAKKMLKRTLLGKTKDDLTFKLLGYTKEELISHITKCDNWDKLKVDNWEIDHYFPIAAFIDYGIYDIKIINCLDNLRVLSSQDNKEKNSFYDKKEFENWLKNKKLI